MSDSHDLAIMGGQPLRSEPWPVYNTIGEEEKREVLEVLDSGVLSAFIASCGQSFYGGQKVQVLEKEWSSFFDARYSVSMNSATSALYAALVACGVGQGDEVIIPQLGMSAAAAVIKITGAEPVFVDCNPQTMLVEPQSILSHITTRTKAIIAINLAGQVASMDIINSIAKENGCFVIEDNAQAINARFNGKFAGTIGDIGVFSLNCHKIIQSGEGGIACTDDEDLANKLRLVRNHAEKCLGGFNLENEKIFGLNLRMTEMEAAVAVRQLKKLAPLTEETIKLADHLRSNLKIDGIAHPLINDGSTHVYYIYHWCYLEDLIGISADLFSKALQEEGFPVFAHYGYLMSMLPPFICNHSINYDEYNRIHYPGALYAVKNSLWTMGIRPGISFNDIDLLIAAFHKVYAKKEQLSEWAKSKY